MDRELLIGLLLAVPILIHTIPLVGLASRERVEGLYGIELPTPELVLIVRHRAVLFGILAALLVAAIIDPEIRCWAISLVLVSDVVFAVLAGTSTPLNAQTKRVVTADLVSIAFLVAAGAVVKFS